MERVFEYMWWASGNQGRIAYCILFTDPNNHHATYGQPSFNLRSTFDQMYGLSNDDRKMGPVLTNDEKRIGEDWK